MIDALGSMTFPEPVSWFVYEGASKHLWRFVYFSPAALTGSEAISQALAEAVEMGNTPSGSYMAAPTQALWTLDLSEREQGGTDA
jgi:hypothetical protein